MSDRSPSAAKPPRSLSRRDFIQRATQASAALGLILAGCEDDSGEGARADARAPDGGVLDSGAPDLGTLDGGAPDAELQDSEPADGALPDHPLASLPDAPVVKGPWLHILGDEIVLRFESLPHFSATASVRPEAGGEPVALDLQGEDQQVEFQWPSRPERLDFGDHRGLYTLWTARLRDLTPGARYTWTVDIGPASVSGSFRAPPAPGEGFTAVWLSDTMWPGSPLVTALIAEWDFDVLLHGGDIQYMTNPLDTWNGMFHHMAPLMRRAPIQLCVGNHESELQDEYTTQYVRLFGVQGDNAPREDFHTFDYGSLRFIMMNSEADQTGPEQLQWLQAQLDGVSADDDLKRAVVAFHRPLYTFSKASANRGARATLAPILQAAPVPLVLTGHNHCYERFQADGITYVVDGGGGAFTYDIDATRPEVEAEHPEEIPLRLVAEQTHGAMRIQVDGEGGMIIERWNIDGELTDRFEI